MGVEKFFSSLKKEYTDKQQFIYKLNYKISCQHLLIDFNSIIHVVSQYLLKSIKIEYTKDSFEELLIKQVEIFINEMLNNLDINKLKSIYMCIDGVPTMAKIFEQKKRRYMGDLLSYISGNSNVKWSRNNISPGTDFMIDMVKYLNSEEFKSNIKKKCNNLTKLIISGISEDGEGEFKIIKFIEMIPKNEEITVYSPDSDMIILLFLVNRSINMLRYDQQKSTYDNPSYDIVHIDKFKNIIIAYINEKSILNNLIEENIIADIVFILSIFGDDFLPKLETVRVNTDINILIDFYIVIIARYGYILRYNHILQKRIYYELNTNTFLEYLKLIQCKEQYFIERNAKHHVLSNYHKIDKQILGDSLYKIRDLMINYIWKFIYLNKPKDISVKPMNVSKYITVEKFIVSIENTEINIDYKLLNNFTKLNVNSIGWNNCLKSMYQLISYNFIEIIQNINGKLLVSTKQVHYIEYTPQQMLEALLVYFYNTYELPFTVPIQLTNEKLNINNYSSDKPPHNKRIKELNSKDRENYLIENKLDKYYNILHPKDNFYYSISLLSNSIDYNIYYNNFHNTPIKDIVNDYISGLNWILNYYHNHIIDRGWYYRFNRSPMLHDIIKYYDPKIFTTKERNENLLLSPLEHYLFVSPLHIDNIKPSQFIMIQKYNKKIPDIIKFINNNKKYYYELNNIKKLQDSKQIDCSTSHFISKCNLLFMEDYINIDDYIKDIRKYIF